ncbi:amino acid ABC transporter permease [Nitratidesulfovibrio sp. SRB-5]|uniref:amino acid ABC transporter permease n=1 Tax=Nitratidesulfovibrio sp. SRB-5 TaxID=2872636 RepID=UPI0010267F3E|nr:amino acid ABC transporter permease [Nitratidesulfovibrio sp. SRB-5]MBZ2170958.1 amino acid ABC transporter permease [Nitratidesulfovibrio sp. SRB-5]RXF76152.1 amino acid ABC transporter permease [Desulfovibrio sp. DS-1]
MIRYWLEKTWVQNAVLISLATFAIYYCGWVFDFGYEFKWSMLFTRNETYGVVMGAEILKGLANTVRISLISSALALLLGTMLGLARLSLFRPLRATATCVIEFFRNTPLLIQLFFWYFAFPAILPDNAREALFSIQFEFWCATIGLSIYTASFMAEVIRAGLQSIPKGLLEAAYSSGLSYFQVLRTIILPLAFRAIIPPLGSEFLNNMKNSSLAMVVGVAELTWHAQQVESLTFKGFEATSAATVLYLSLSLIISFILNGVNGRMRLDTAPGRSIPVLVVGALLTPLGLIRRMFIRPVTRALRARRRAAAETTYTPLAAMLHQLGGHAARAAALTGKGLFVAMLAGLLYSVGKGLLGFQWHVVFENLRSLLIWHFPTGRPDEMFLGLGGLAYSLLMAVIAISVSFFIGLAVGVGRSSSNRVFRIPCLLYIELIRGNPLIIVIFWVYFFIPVMFGTTLNVFWSATWALTAFTGAYLAEIVRTGIQNIPAGQVEAAYSTGLTYLQAMRKIVLPQALKQMIPAIVGQFIAIFKDTSLAFVLGVLELTFVAQGINNRLMIHPMEIYGTVAFLYFICCYSMSVFAARLERRLSPEKVSLRM